MSFAKRQLERADAQRSLAIEILVEAGVFERCKLHEEPYDTWGDVDEAKALGRKQFHKGELGDTFASVAEVDQAIDDAKNDHGDSCPLCDKIAAD